MTTLPQRSLHWTLRLPAAPDLVLPALEAAVGGEVYLLARGPSRWVLSCSPTDLTLRFAVEVRPHEHGAEVVVAPAGQRTAAVYYMAVLLGLFVAYMGFAIMRASILIGALFVLKAAWALVYLARDRRDAHRQRVAEFTKIAAALDRALGPLKSGDPRLYRALAPGDDPPLKTPRRRRPR